MGGIEVKDLVFTYPGTSSETLRGVDLTVGEGEFLSLIGPSGCGKSSLLRLLAGLERPESGSLFCGGVPITGPGQRPRRRLPEPRPVSMDDGAG